MRILLPDHVKARVQAEVAKDFTRQSTDQLWQKLAATVTPLATRIRRRVA
jgi:hypothetical protein